jgi:ligand-binding sensor domain-containing protein
MRRFGYWIRQGGFLLLPAVAAMAAAAQHYPILPVLNSPHGIFTMMQDSQSALWLGSIDDVYRFDGEHFYSLRQYGFPKETPNSFAEDNDGGIWIATQGTDVGGGTGHGGLYRYQGGHIKKEFSADGLSVVAISPGIMLASIGSELSGKPAFGDIVLFHKSGNDWIPTRLLEKQADHLTVDHQGNVLFPCPGGWCEISRQRLREWRGPESPLEVQRHSGSPLIERVLRDRFGCMWFRAEAFASYQCPADPQPEIIPQSVSLYDSSDHLEETADGSIFMLVYLALGRPGAFHVATRSQGLPEPMDTAMVARDGTIWIGAENGLYRFMYPFHLESWDKTEGIGIPFSILRRGQDIFSTSGGILKLTDDRRRWMPLPGTENFGGSLIAGPDETFVTATPSHVFELSGKGQVLAQSTLPDVSSPDFGLAGTPAGNIWLGHNGIIDVVKRGKELTLHPENVPKRHISDIQYDSARDTLWACDGNDVVFRKDGAWGGITKKEGLLDLACAAIGIQGNGDLWVGYGADAAAWIANPASGHPVIHNYTQRLNRVVANSSTHILSVDHHGWLWMANDVMRVASPDAAKTGEWIQLDEADGLSPTVMGHPFLSDEDGSVWIGTNAGVTHFSPPEDFVTRFPPPPVFIAGFSLGQGREILADAVADIPRDVNLLAHVGSLQFDRRNALHLRYRFLPGQSSWTETNSFDLLLGKLRWGRHTLQVQAQLATGPWSPIVEQTLTVEWPIWLSWPLLLTYGAAGMGIGAGAALWRRRRKFERELSLPDLSTWRMSALSPETESLIGTRVDGRYEIGHVLSVGGFATVVRARDLDNDGRLCAVKVFRYEFGDRAWIRHRFEQEILALEQLAHPNIVRITGHGTIDTGAPYLVMEFIHGHSLREHLDKGALPNGQMGIFLRQIAGALHSLHERAIYHRDLKPENLMIRAGDQDQPEIVLIDFSIAIVKSRDQTFHGISRVAGTLEYMAPEQVIGFADASTDIYALAKIVMEMLTGSRWSDLFPEAALDLPEQIGEYFRKNAVILRADSIGHIVSAMAFDPVGRPKDVVEFVRPIVRDLEQNP